MRVAGSGKRARAGGDDAVNRASKLRDIEDALGTVMLRANAVPNAAPIVGQLCNVFMVYIRDSKAMPTIAFTNKLANIRNDDVIGLLTACTSHNLSTRLKSIASVFFTQQFEVIAEVRKQLAMVEKGCSDALEFVIMSQYGLEGVVSWTTLTKDVGIHIAQRGVANGVAAAAANAAAAGAAAAGAAEVDG